MELRLGFAFLVAAGCLAACGGGGGGGDGGTTTTNNGGGGTPAPTPTPNPGPSPTFTVGGSVTGLSGAGLVLQVNGGSDLGVSASGTFTFAAALSSGADYAVTVLTQPTGQNCTVANGSGTVGAGNVTGVSVSCASLATFSIDTLNDPLASQQWHLKNTGQKAFSDSTGTVGEDINVDPVFSTFGFTGANVIVGVVDTGLEIAHEDLAANVVLGGSWNFNFPASGNSQTDPTNTVDTDGDHGTNVAGLIAMVRNNVGGIGVAPSARLKGFNWLSTLGSTQDFIDSAGGSSANPNSSDVSVFNQSFGFSPTTPMSIDPSIEAQYLAGVTSLRGGKGAIYVKSAGNGFTGVCQARTGVITGISCENANFDPANTVPYQILVGATRATPVKADYSTAGSAIWVSAPGGEFGQNNPLVPFNVLTPESVMPAMVTTDQSGCAAGFASTTVTHRSFFDNGVAVPPGTDVPNPSCNYTNRMNGTSAAAPMVVGVVALMLEANPGLTWRDVKHILASTSKQINALITPTSVLLPNPVVQSVYTTEPAWTTNAAGFKFHNWYGFGRVDAFAAVSMARAMVPSQLGTFTDTGFISSGTLSLSIPAASTIGASSTLSVPAAPVHFIEAVQIEASVTHPVIRDIGIELISPSGTRSVVKNILDGYFQTTSLSDQRFLSNAFYGENPAGTWTIKLVDGDRDDLNVGTFTGWSIRVYGH